MDDHGASSSLAFIVAGALFLAAVAVLLITVEKEVPSDTDVQTGYRAHAEAVLALLLETDGIGWSDVTRNWTTTDFRPSLADDPRDLDQDRLETWRECSATVTTRCLVYNDVRARLGLGTLHFNVTVTSASGATIVAFGEAPPLETAQQATDAATAPARRGSEVDFTVTVRVF